MPKICGTLWGLIQLLEDSPHRFIVADAGRDGTHWTGPLLVGGMSDSWSGETPIRPGVFRRALTEGWLDEDMYDPDSRAVRCWRLLVPWPRP